MLFHWTLYQKLQTANSIEKDIEDISLESFCCSQYDPSSKNPQKKQLIQPSEKWALLTKTMTHQGLLDANNPTFGINGDWYSDLWAYLFSIIYNKKTVVAVLSPVLTYRLLLF